MPSIAMRFCKTEATASCLGARNRSHVTCAGTLGGACCDGGVVGDRGPTSRDSLSPRAPSRRSRVALDGFDTARATRPVAIASAAWAEADEDKRQAMQRRACQAGLQGARTDLRRCVAMLMRFDPFREFDRLTEQWRSRQNPARYRSPKALTPRRSRLRPRRPARSPNDRVGVRVRKASSSCDARSPILRHV
jgi:hypothetical protein